MFLFEFDLQAPKLPAKTKVERSLYDEEIEKKTVLVIYPGRFQPFHRGHKSVYDHLVSKFGRDHVYIATSNKVDPPRSPFNFRDKVEFMHLTGVPDDRIVQTVNPYKAEEITKNYNPDSTILIFAVSAKDMAEDPRIKPGYKKDGSPTYMQAMPKNISECEPLSQHGYVLTVPTTTFNVLGKPMQSATELRAQFAAANEQTRKAIIKDLFGKYSDEAYNIMSQKITESFRDFKSREQNAGVEHETNNIAIVINNKIWKVIPNDPARANKIVATIKGNAQAKGRPVSATWMLTAAAITEAKTPDKLPAEKPRNFVAKNAVQGNAGAHKDKKKAMKQGQVKHKKDLFKESEATYDARPKLRKYTKEMPDGSKIDYYEVLNHRGMVVKGGMSRLMAASYLRNHYGDLVAEAYMKGGQRLK